MLVVESKMVLDNKCSYQIVLGGLLIYEWFAPETLKKNFIDHPKGIEEFYLTQQHIHSD